MKKKDKLENRIESVEDKLIESEQRPEKYESRYKHGGPGRTVKKKKQF
jgi:hypothetical protein